jgi:hypothetical protein
MSEEFIVCKIQLSSFVEPINRQEIYNLGHVCRNKFVVFRATSQINDVQLHNHIANRLTTNGRQLRCTDRQVHNN